MKSEQKFFFITSLHTGIYGICFLVFWLLSYLDEFSFNLNDRKIFRFIGVLFGIFLIPNSIILPLLIRKLHPIFHEQVKQFYKDIRSVKKIQKIGFGVILSGAVICILTFILQGFNIIFISSIFYEGLIDFIFYSSMALILGGSFIFFFFFYKKNMKAKSWRELIDGINEEEEK